MLNYEIKYEETNLVGNDSFGEPSRLATVVQQVEEFERQIRLGKPNWLADLVGQWPGDESDAELERLLKDLD